MEKNSKFFAKNEFLYDLLQYVFGDRLFIIKHVLYTEWVKHNIWRWKLSKPSDQNLLCSGEFFRLWRQIKIVEVLHFFSDLALKHWIELSDLKL